MKRCTHSRQGSPESRRLIPAPDRLENTASDILPWIYAVRPLTPMINLPDLDLELISVFEAMLKFKSVSRAANELNTSQPALSQALAKLRLHFSDQLFVRTSEGMIPTPCAVALAPPLLKILRIYREQVQQRSSFDPATSEQLFSIAASDIGELIFIPALIQTLATMAPRIQLRANRLEGGSLLESLQTGDVDMAIGSFPSLEAGIHERRLFTERYVCLVREGHPAIRDQLTEDAFLSGSHILVEAHAVGHIHLRAERTLRKLISSHMIKASSQSFLVGAFLLNSTDCNR
ncbi:DNA-binding transcriptional regulator, LysR family [Burkholderia sp. OK233]|nr:DNA-binding transcriptional regulator, LysR family [Burkholderia sp. OK233]